MLDVSSLSWLDCLTFAPFVLPCDLRVIGDSKIFILRSIIRLVKLASIS
jgi:hypothetical protein